jgi:DNA polymerase-3 subunit gamma/tau
VRDGLSLLDQALSLAGSKVTEDIVREMLGIADRGLVFDLLETVMKGDAANALKQMGALYDGGADPAMVLQELLELAYFLTRLKLAPDLGQDDPGYEGERGRGLPLAQKLGMAELSRAWQMLLKGLGEVQTAPSPLQAAEMVLVRLSYVADLPAPAELVKALESAAPATASPAPAPAPSPRNGGAPRMAASGDGGVSAAPRMQPHEMEAPLPAGPQSFLEVMELFDQHRERILRGHLVNDAHLVRFEAGRIELRLTPAAPRDLPNKLGQLLSQWTGRRWVVSISSEPGEPTLGAQAATREAGLRDEAANDPRVRAVLEAFPGARIAEIRESLAETAPLVAINDAAPDIIVEAEDEDDIL